MSVQPCRVVPLVLACCVLFACAANRPVESSDPGCEPHEGHHVYPRALREWFAAQGINIDEFILPLEVSEHRRIH